MLKKFLCAVLLLMMASAAAYAATLPAACDPTNKLYSLGNAQPKFIAAGSSAMWTAMALGTYNAGAGVLGATTGPVYHYVSAAKFNLQDTRLVTAFGSSAANTVVDSGTIWIVWDAATTYNTTLKITQCTPHVFAYVNLDSVIGNRAYFGKGTIVSPTSWPAGNGTLYNGISTSLWGDGSTDSTVPANVQAAFGYCASGYTGTCTTGVGSTVNVGATDIRPEDAFYASNRVNSLYTAGGAYEGLGYGTNVFLNGHTGDPTSPLTCTGSPLAPQGTLAQLQGTDIQGDYAFLSGSTWATDSKFHVVAFNIQGNDPITCTPITAWDVLPVGAAPIVFVYSKTASPSPLAGLTNATEQQLQQVFSGANTDASAFGLASGAIAAYLREPLSGTMNTTEETIFRHPSSLATFRFSQEAGINGAVNNPAGGTVCSGSPVSCTQGPGLDNRWRAIGTGDEVKSVAHSLVNHTLDGIGYAFFSYGNVQPIWSGAYGYISLNGIDPVFHNYVGGTGGVTDPGQSSTPGTIPSLTTLPASCSSTFPCPESAIWSADPVFPSSGLSFPNLRNGSYPAWSTLRLVVGAPGTTGSAYVTATQIITSSNKYVVSTVPDYVPFAAVKNGTTVIDPGLQLVRSHFGCTVQSCGNVATGVLKGAANNPELGRDAGGSILPLGDIKANITQDSNGGFVTFNF